MNRNNPQHRYNIAHRGARSLAPENTLPAFLKAWQVGAHGIETDVQVTSDGVPVLFHDSHLRRTTNIAEIFPKRKNKPLYTFTLEEILRLDAGTWYRDTDPFSSIASGSVDSTEAQAICGTKIPLLEDTLLFVRDKAWFINIEIKPLSRENESFPVVEEVLRLIENVNLKPEHFSLSSFHHPFLRQAKSLRSDIEVNALIGGDTGKMQLWGNYEFGIYNANVDLIDTVQIEKAYSHGCRINLYTVNRLSEMKRYLSLGIEKIITDYPQVLADEPFRGRKEQ
jgi:glycerophosphoryl diester phosphodiesterase